MPKHKSRFVLVCRQVLACATVAALAAPAVGVMSLDIVGPAPEPAPVPGSMPGSMPGWGAAAATASAVASVATEPVEPEVTEVPLDGVEEAGLEALTSSPGAQQRAEDELAVLSAPASVEGFATIGVTWASGERLSEDEVEVSVRTREDGEWSTWQTIEYHDDHGPDPDSAEGRRARQGTEPIVVGDVDDVQVKMETADGEMPANAELAVVDPQVTPGAHLAEPAIDTSELGDGGESGLALSSGTTAGVSLAASTVTPKPRIFSRAQWGADERMRRAAPTYFEVHAGFVHHTVNGNDYTRSQVPSILRGIYAYHTQSRGWSDIGYNFIVDKFGRIWEGRYGGVDRPVVGAHTLGYNEYSFAMSALGNFDVAQPSAAMVDAYGRLFAWKLSLHGVSASSTSQGVGSRTFPAVNGHRDAGSTACPGRYLYARLGTIRSLAGQYQAPFTGRARQTNLAGSGWPDLVVRDQASKRLFTVRTGGQTGFLRAHRALTGVSGTDLATTVPDLTGDNIPDLLARDAATKLTALHAGTRQGLFGAKSGDIARFANADQLVGSPDLTGDGWPDVVSRVGTTKRLLVHPSNRQGGFRKKRTLAVDWSAYNLTAAVGDLSGDGRNDLVARSGRRLFLVPGTGRGLAAPVLLGGRWDGYSVITGSGDLTNDGLPDVVVQERTSKIVYLFPGTGSAKLGPRIGPFKQFRGLDLLHSAGRLVGGAGADLVGRNANGQILVYPNNDRRNVEAVRDTGVLLRGADLVLNVGDWNGDGFGDIMSRSSRLGHMYLRPGDGQGGFGAAQLAATSWRGVTLLAAVGDVTGDGRPDLMGQPAGGAMRIYPGDGVHGFLPSYVAHSAVSSNRHTGLGLWNADGSPDSLFRRSDGSLVVYPGNGPGGLTNPRQVGAGMGGYDWLKSVGDADGDGRPDLVGRQAGSGNLWFFRGTANGFTGRRLLGAGFEGFDLVG